MCIIAIRQLVHQYVVVLMSTHATQSDVNILWNTLRVRCQLLRRESVVYAIYAKDKY